MLTNIKPGLYRMRNGDPAVVIDRLGRGYYQSKKNSDWIFVVWTIDDGKSDFPKESPLDLMECIEC